jgi:hypothetical protein
MSSDLVALDAWLRHRHPLEVASVSALETESVRRAARTDANQQPIVAALRKCGASVQDLSAVGGGVADLLVGFRGTLRMLEVKDGDKPPSRRALTPAQKRWHAAWSAYVVVVESVEQAIEMVTGRKI